MKTLEFIAGCAAVVACMAFYAWMRGRIRDSELRKALRVDLKHSTPAG